MKIHLIDGIYELFRSHFGAPPKKSPSGGLFNAGLEAKATRAIDIGENDKIDENALKELNRAALAQNMAGSKKK